VVRIVKTLVWLILAAALLCLPVLGNGAAPNDVFEDQPDTDRSGLATHDGDTVSDTELAEWLGELLRKDGKANASVAILLFQQCFGGGMLDDIKDKLGSVVPWVGGAASKHDETARGEVSPTENRDANGNRKYSERSESNTPENYWTRALAEALEQSPSATMWQILEAARRNDPIGSNAKRPADRYETGQTASANGGHKQQLQPTGSKSFHAVLWGGHANRERHRNNVSSILKALKGRYNAQTCSITILFGDGEHDSNGDGLPANWKTDASFKGSLNVQSASKNGLKTTLQNLKAKMGPGEQFFFYGSDHGSRRQRALPPATTLPPRRRIRREVDIPTRLLKELLPAGRPSVDFLPRRDADIANLHVTFNGITLHPTQGPSNWWHYFIDPAKLKTQGNELEVENTGTDDVTLDEVLFSTGPVSDSPPPLFEDSTLVIGLDGYVGTLDPRLALTPAEVQVTNSLFDRLIYVEPEDNAPMPWLAESWEIVSDSVARFRLQQGVRFHNGDPLTAHDVAFTLDWLRDPANGSPRAYELHWLEAVEVLDDHTLEVHTRPESAPFTSLLSMLDQPIVPMDYVLAMGDEEFGLSPVGSGAYRLVEWLSGDRVVVEENEEYWAAYPSLSQVVYRSFGDPMTKMAALRTGDIDVATGVSATETSLVESDPAIGILTAPRLGCAQLFFNLDSPIAGDVRFRQAVYQSLDWNQLVEDALPASEIRAFGAIPPSLPASDRDYLSAEVAMAEDDDMAAMLFEELLAEGVLPWDYTLSIVAPINQQIITLSIALASSLEENGVWAEVRPIDDRPLLSTVADRPEWRDFEMIWWDWRAGGDPYEYLYPLFHSDTAIAGGVTNFSGTRLPEVDWLIDEAVRTTDEDVRVQSYIDAQRLVYENVSAIPVYHGTMSLGVREGIEGLVVDSASDLWITTPYHDVWKVEMP